MIEIDARTARLMLRMSRAARSLTPSAAEHVDMIATGVLAAVRAGEWPAGPNRGVVVSATALASLLNVKRWPVRRALKTLATFSVLNVYRFRIGGAYRTEVLINPRVTDALTNGRAAEVKDLAITLAAVGAHRLESASKTGQGFTQTVDYGAVEPSDTPKDQNAPESTPDALMPADLVKAARLKADPSIVQKMRKEAKDERKRLVHRFVRCAAESWVRGQVSLGQMSEGNYQPPIWYAARYHELSDIGRREYRELVNMFETYGGKVTAIAWRFYCGSHTKYDAKQQTKFDPTRSFAQQTNTDRRPSSFVKHFGAILANDTYKRYAASERALIRAREEFGDLIDVPSIREPFTVPRPAPPRPEGAPPLPVNIDAPPVAPATPPVEELVPL